MKPRSLVPLLLLSFLISALAGRAADAASTAAPTRVFELRIYHTNADKMDALLTRFRDHTCAIFARLGMESVGYWVQADVPEGESPKLYYILAHPSREAAKEAWAKFMADPEWKAAYADSIKEGRLVNQVESIFLNPADFSAIR